MYDRSGGRLGRGDRSGLRSDDRRACRGRGVRDAVARHVPETSHELPRRNDVHYDVDSHRDADVTRASVRVDDDEARRIDRGPLVLRDTFARAGFLVALGDMMIGSCESGRTEPRHDGEDVQDSRGDHDLTITSLRATNFPNRSNECHRVR